MVYTSDAVKRRTRRHTLRRFAALVMGLIATVQGYRKPYSKQLKFSVTLYPSLPYCRPYNTLFSREEIFAKT